MSLKRIYFNLNILHFSFLLFSARESKVIGNYITENEDFTSEKIFDMEYTEKLVDLRKGNLDVEKELQKIIETTLHTYQNMEDFQNHPSVDIAVVLPTDFGEKFVPQATKEMIEDIISNVCVIFNNCIQLNKVLSFSVDFTMRVIYTAVIQNIKVTFKLSDETLKCLDQLQQINDVTTSREDSNSWCFNEIEWNSNGETEDNTEILHLGKKRRNLENLSIIDVSNKNWIHILYHIIGGILNAEQLRQSQSNQIALNLLAPNNFERDDYLMMLKHADDLVKQRTQGIRFIKYLVNPRMHGVKLRELNMIILSNPLDEEEEQNREYIKRMSIKELIPRLQQEYTKFIFYHESVFNAVDVSEDNESENRYRLVLRVYNRWYNCPKMTFRVIRNVVLGMTAYNFKDISFRCHYNDYDFDNPSDDYLILTFEILEPPIDTSDDFVRKILTKPILPYLQKIHPCQQLDPSIRRKYIEYTGMYDVYEYEVFIRVLRGQQITPEMLENLLKQLTQKYPIFNVTCNILESDSFNPKFKLLKFCLEVKIINKEDCYNPWTAEGKKEFFLSALDDTKPPVVPPGGTPPKEASVVIPQGGNLDYTGRRASGYIELKLKLFSDHLKKI